MWQVDFAIHIFLNQNEAYMYMSSVNCPMLEKFGNFYRLIKIIVIIITTLFKEGNTQK